MDNNVADKALPRKFAQKKAAQEQKTTWESLRASSGMFILIGLLVTATGLIVAEGFHNPLSKLAIVSGLLLFFLGFAVKMLDVLMQIMGGGR